MVVVEFKLEYFKKLSGLEEEKIVDGLTSLGAPCEIEDRQDGRMLVVELTPNRPDWFSIEGLIRALHSYYGNKKKKTEYSAHKNGYVTIIDRSVENIRPYTVNAVIMGVELTEDGILNLMQLQEKLTTTLGRNIKKFGMGFFNLDKIKFPVRYTAMEPERIVYKPLNYPHSADANEILEKHVKGKEYGNLIKNFEKYPVFVDASGAILALVPIVNSDGAGKISAVTNNLFIEVTGMELSTIKQTLNIVVCACMDMGGKAYQVEMRYGNKRLHTPDLKPGKMKVNKELVGRILGKKISREQFWDFLIRMGYGRSGDDVIIPPYRVDVKHEVDIIEDIAIAHGYNKFTPTTPDFFNEGKSSDDFYSKADCIMRGMGFLEIKTPVLVGSRNIIGNVNDNENTVKVMNPASEENSVLRANFTGNLLSVFLLNKTKGLPQKFYEIGYVFDGLKMRKKIVFGLMDRELDFSRIRGYFQTLSKELGIGSRLEKMKKESCFDNNEAAEIFVGKNPVGVIGKINSETAHARGLFFPVYIVEMVFVGE